MGIETALLGASIGLGIFERSQSRREARRAQKADIAFDARTARLQSTAILEEAALEAEEIRRGGELLGKKQTALTAKAGLKLGRGTAKDIQEETKRLTEKDVATTLEAAERESKRLLLTFDPETQRKEAIGKALEEAGTALESAIPLGPGNFIKSRSKKQTFTFQGL